MNCDICGQSLTVCDCYMRVGITCAVLAEGDPKETKRLHRRYAKLPNYEAIVTIARRMTYHHETATQAISHIQEARQ